MTNICVFGYWARRIDLTVLYRKKKRREISRAFFSSMRLLILDLWKKNYRKIKKKKKPLQIWKNNFNNLSTNFLNDAKSLNDTKLAREILRPHKLLNSSRFWPLLKPSVFGGVKTWNRFASLTPCWLCFYP